jgi:GTP cyclohydrolase I
LGYVPNKTIIGASKISRIVDYYSARLQVQERLGIDIINCIEESIKPLGSIIVMRGRHLCKEMRGVKKFDSPFETIEARGILLDNKDGIKDEFMSRISNPSFI